MIYKETYSMNNRNSAHELQQEISRVEHKGQEEKGREQITTDPPC